jgi:hypothetical protein
MEREHARHRERELANLKALEFDVSKARESLRADLAKIADKEQAEKIAKKQAEAIEERNVRWMAEEAEFRAAEAKRSKEMLDLRKEMLREEAKMQRLERQNAASHRRATEKVEAVNEAIRQLQGGAPRSEPSNQLLEELRRKVDALQRDVTELRRELRRPPGERDK